MTLDEIKKGTGLYNKMLKEHFGSLYYKSACDRYKKFKHNMAEKYNITTIKIHNEILSNRNISKETEQRWNKMPPLKDRTGEINIAKNGLEMTIIEYYNSKNITVKFSDGIIVYNKEYNAFKKGTVKHPTKSAHALSKLIKDAKLKQKHYAAKRIGETNTMNCGAVCKIIEYNRTDDITVEFINSHIRKKAGYKEFKKGEIQDPTEPLARFKNRTGEKNVANNGMQMTIIKYHSNRDIDITFKNGMIVRHKTYTAFKKGCIKIPNLINNIKIKEFAYQFKNEWYYICTFPEWIEDKILSVKEMYDYHH